MKRGGVRGEESFALGDELVESVARFHEGPLTFEAQVLDVLGQQDLAEATGEGEVRGGTEVVEKTLMGSSEKKLSS